MAQGPFDATHAYVQWGGALPGGDEWSCGLRMQVTGAAAFPQDTQAALAGVAAAVQAFHVSDGLISPRCLLQYVKFNGITPEGKYASQTTVEHLYADIPGAGAVGATPPNQVALAMTLNTAFNRGLGSKGRFYIPLPTFLPADDGRISEANAQLIAGYGNTLVAALNAVDPDFDVAVFSRKLGAPVHRPVTHCSVGRTLDTIRRRRNKVREDHQVAA